MVRVDVVVVVVCQWSFWAVKQRFRLEFIGHQRLTAGAHSATYPRHVSR
jgi:hypothetical protein